MLIHRLADRGIVKLTEITFSNFVENVEKYVFLCSKLVNIHSTKCLKNEKLFFKLVNIPLISRFENSCFTPLKTYY